VRRQSGEHRLQLIIGASERASETVHSRRVKTGCCVSRRGGVVGHDVFSQNDKVLITVHVTATAVTIYEILTLHLACLDPTAMVHFMPIRPSMGWPVDFVRQRGAWAGCGPMNQPHNLQHMAQIHEKIPYIRRRLSLVGEC